MWRTLVNGWWRENPALVQMLGLCPLLAVSTTLVNALCLGLATTLVLALSNTAVSLLRNFVPTELRIPVFVLLIAVLVTIVQLLMNAYLHPVYVVLGIFVPLIVTNCLVLARAETFASKTSPWRALLDGVGMGIGLTFALALIGAARELIGKGTLLSGVELAFGSHAQHWTWQLIPQEFSFLLATLPAGGFIIVGLIIALRNVLSQRSANQSNAPAPNAADA